MAGEFGRHVGWELFGTDLKVSKALVKTGKFLPEIDYPEIREGTASLPGAVFGRTHKSGTHTTSLPRGVDR
jgi:hypothetical protein